MFLRCVSELVIESREVGRFPSCPHLQSSAPILMIPCVRCGGNGLEVNVGCCFLWFLTLKMLVSVSLFPAWCKISPSSSIFFPSSL